MHYNWKGFGISEEAWTIIMIAVGALIVSLTLYRLNNPFIGLSVIWAFTGIIIKRQDDYRSIVITAAIALSIVTLLQLYNILQKEYNRDG